eukprot:TRINITY_DN121676_c0_g1_i1.p1 TRINITY_DN121676_c0_g1~~TRINITY_DN121676_c0_g1_i1.p1  ORF type:complete len:854 (-),score=171.16 TRINITY_DN121676_c0_g1_i1:197-2758(-)
MAHACLPLCKASRIKQLVPEDGVVRVRPLHKDVFDDKFSKILGRSAVLSSVDEASAELALYADRPRTPPRSRPFPRRVQLNRFPLRGIRRPGGPPCCSTPTIPSKADMRNADDFVAFLEPDLEEFPSISTVRAALCDANEVPSGASSAVSESSDIGRPHSPDDGTPNSMPVRRRSVTPELPEHLASEREEGNDADEDDEEANEVVHRGSLIGLVKKSMMAAPVVLGELERASPPVPPTIQEAQDEDEDSDTDGDYERSRCAGEEEYNVPPEAFRRAPSRQVQDPQRPVEQSLVDAVITPNMMKANFKVWLRRMLLLHGEFVDEGEYLPEDEYREVAVDTSGIIPPSWPSGNGSIPSLDGHMTVGELGMQDGYYRSSPSDSPRAWQGIQHEVAKIDSAEKMRRKAARHVKKAGWKQVAGVAAPDSPVSQDGSAQWSESPQSSLCSPRAAEGRQFRYRERDLLAFHTAIPEHTLFLGPPPTGRAPADATSGRGSAASEVQAEMHSPTNPEERGQTRASKLKKDATNKLKENCKRRNSDSPVAPPYRVAPIARCPRARPLLAPGWRYASTIGSQGSDRLGLQVLSRTAHVRSCVVHRAAASRSSTPAGVTSRSGTPIERSRPKSGGFRHSTQARKPTITRSEVGERSSSLLCASQVLGLPETRRLERDHKRTFLGDQRPNSPDSWNRYSGCASMTSMNEYVRSNSSKLPPGMTRWDSEPCNDDSPLHDSEPRTLTIPTHAVTQVDLDRLLQYADDTGEADRTTARSSESSLKSASRGPRPSDMMESSVEEEVLIQRTPRSHPTWSGSRRPSKRRAPNSRLPTVNMAIDMKKLKAGSVESFTSDDEEEETTAADTGG